MNFSQALQYLLLGLAPLALAAFLAGTRTATAKAKGASLRSPREFYGWYAVSWVLAPSLAVSLIGTVLHLFNLIEVPPSMLLAAGAAAACGGALFALQGITPTMRARHRVEKFIIRLLVVSSLISILTTIGIVLSVLFEALVFFKQVSIWDFLTGTSWNPDTAFLESAGRGAEQAAKPEFGSVPLFAGTFIISGIAMLVAVPVGLFSAIYMSEYATPFMRKVVKPTLEILAGIPTVVYGFFAAITVSPFIVHVAEAFGLQADFTNALSPGLVMGVMIIPLVSSLSDDVINAVPMSLREGSYALGATRSETIKRVVLPAALPGVVSAVLLAASRAIGETMIVVMAAGLMPTLTWNPLKSMTTVNVRIVDALTGDQSFDSLETLSAFGLGLVLLILTLILNVVSAYVIRRFRQKYE